MNLAHPSTLLLPAAVALLVGWRLVSRLKRMVGRQRLSPVRPWLAVVLFPLLIALLMLTSLARPASALALVAGAVAGIALGLLGLRLTRFEETPLGLFYTPNAHLGIALTLLLVVRIGYRFASLSLDPGTIAPPPADFARSPLTLLIFATLAGYYACYAAGLIRWQRRAVGRPPE